MAETIGCSECAKPLAEDERHYYTNRCEECERDWSDRITAWRKGGEDKELDALYDVPPAVRH